MDLRRFFHRIALCGLAFLIFGFASCPGGSGAKFHVLSADGTWIRQSDSVLPEGELLLMADSDGGGMLGGDTVKAIGWNSAKDGSGVPFDPDAPAAGDWYAVYEVTKCTVRFSTGFGEGNDLEPASVDESCSWKAVAPDTSGVRSHFVATWYKDGGLTDAFDFANDEVRHSMTLYAEWETPLCLTALANGCSVTLRDEGGFADVSLETSTDGGANWTEYVPGETGAIALNDGESVYFSAVDSNAGFSIGDFEFYQFDFGSDADRKIAASGNVMSLLDGTLALKDLSSMDCAFRNLFKDCKSLTSAPTLPATTLAERCYEFMFSGCTSLVSAPALPAKTLADFCYEGMFFGCTSLVSVPALPAKTLARFCYESMFRECSSLESAPALPATVLANNCYEKMFRKCQSLKSVPALPATSLPGCCYQDMFSECWDIKLSQMPSVDYPTPYRVPFSGDVVEEGEDCAYDMFYGTEGDVSDEFTINTVYYLHKDNAVVGVAQVV